jgi:SAM-dependent methyltransferase
MKPEPTPAKTTDFDTYAGDYDSALNRGISVSGESKIYFARERIAWLKKCLDTLGTHPRSVLDFGCGTGTATRFFIELLGADSVIGADRSDRSLAVAREREPSERARFVLFDNYRTDATIDLAFCNGVFHHIPRGNRAEAIAYIHRALAPAGLFAFWENNPWNPGTRYVMSRIPFDRDAETLSVLEARRILREGGFEVIRTDFIFIFPRMLGWLRGLEPALCRLPIGAQYMVLCRKVSPRN